MSPGNEKTGRGASMRGRLRGALVGALALAMSLVVVSGAGATQYEEDAPIGTGAGLAVGVAVDQSNGNVYLSEFYGPGPAPPGNISRFDADGNPLSPATMGADSFTGITVSPLAGHPVYAASIPRLTTVTSASTETLVGFTAAGSPMAGPFPISKGSVASIAATASGGILVPSMGEDTVMEFDAQTGAVRQTITCSACPGLADFTGVAGVAVDPSGNIYVGTLGGDRSEVQAMAISATGGTFTLTFNGQTTAAIAFNAKNAAIDAALEALSSIGPGNVSITGSGANREITFEGSLKNQDQPLLTADSSGLSGGTSTVKVSPYFGGYGNGPSRVMKFGANGDADSVAPTVFSQGSSGSITVNPTNGHVFVAEKSSSAWHVVEYDETGSKLSDFGLNVIEDGLAFGAGPGIAVNASTGAIYVADVMDSFEFGFARVFVPLPEPTAITEAASDITSSSATLNGLVNPKGQVTEDCHFEWGLAEGNYSLGSTPCDPDPFNESDPVAVSGEIDGLTSEVTYHYRVVVKTEGGTTNGNDSEFTTPVPAPQATTEAATGVSQMAATLNAKVDAEGDDADCSFQYGTTVAYGSTLPCSINPVTGTASTVVSAALSGLLPGTTYHYRVVATNSGGTTNGADVAFTTASPPPPPPPPSSGGSGSIPAPPSPSTSAPPLAERPLKCKKGFKKKTVKGKAKCVKVKKRKKR